MHTPASTTGSSPAVAAPRPVARRSQLLRIAIGPIAGGAALVLVASGVLRGVPLLAVTGLVALAVPTSRELSRRFLLVGCLFLGWVPFLWWWDLPLGSVGRVGAVLACLVAGLAAWIARSPGAAGRSRRLVPRLRWSDLVAAAGGLLALWVYLPHLRVPGPEVALSRFLRAWDNAAHFDIAEMIRTHGVLINRLPDGVLGDWSYGPYPQGFHAAVAVVMEGLAGPSVGEPGAELVTYAQATGLVVVLALTTVVAGLCSLPSLRRRPLLALPLVVLVVATFGLGPGGMALHNGFPNFYVACALLACVPLFVIQMPKVASPPVLLAGLGGAVVGVSHNWSFLMTAGAVGAIALCIPLRRRRWPSGLREWLWPAIVSAATVVGVGSAWVMLREQPDLANILVLVGPVTPVPVQTLVTVVLGSVAACVAVLVTARRGGGGRMRGTAVRTAAVGLMPAAGAVVIVLVAYFQTRQVGEPGYYFWKYAIALQLLATVVLVAAVAVLAPPLARRGLGTLVPAGAASVLLALVAAQVYGAPVRGLPPPFGSTLAPGVLSREDVKALADRPVPDATTVIAAARAHATEDRVPYILLPFPSEPFYPEPGATPPALLGQWFNALTGRWTERTNDLIDQEIPEEDSVEEAVRAARRVLALDPEAHVVVGPDYVEAVRDGVDEPERVDTW